jgi:acylphosphatase
VQKMALRLAWPRMVRRHVWVSGKVQGVWYRGSCADRARALGVSGWARNLPDGRVEVVAEGDAEAVGALVEWCHEGPPHAHVTEVEVQSEPPQKLMDFSVR